MSRTKSEIVKSGFMLISRCVWSHHTTCLVRLAGQIKCAQAARLGTSMLALNREGLAGLDKVSAGRAESG